MRRRRKSAASIALENQINAGNKKKEWLLPSLLVFPSVFMFVGFALYPFVRAIINAFSATTTQGEFIKWVGLANFKQIFADSSFGLILRNTFVLAGLKLVLTFVPAMLMAMLAARKGKGERIYQTLYVLPMAIAAAPIATVWMYIFRQDSGLLNQLLGTNIAWLREEQWTLLVIAIVTSWGGIASASLYLLVGFRNVSDEVLEAADIDGANWWTKMFRIMIPLASPQIFYVLFLQIMGSFKVFATIDLLTQGGPANASTTLLYRIYNRVNVSGNIQMACAEALILFVIMFVFARLEQKCEEKFVFYQ